MRNLFFLIIAVVTASFPSWGLAGEGVAGVLQAPKIAIAPDTYYPFDEILYIEGLAPIMSTVQVRLQKTGSKPVQLTVKSNELGEWVLAQKVSLVEGEWEVRARTVIGEEKVSEWSQPRILTVVSSGVSFGGIQVRFMSLTFIILLCILAGIGAIGYFMRRITKLRALLLSKEIHEARESLREGLAGLRGNLMEEHRFLNQSGKPLSLEDISRKEHIFRELDRIEKTMEKEIEDIEEKA